MSREKTIFSCRAGTTVTTSWLSHTLSKLANEPIDVAIEDNKVCLSSYSLKTEKEYFDLIGEQGWTVVGFDVDNIPRSENPKVYVIFSSDDPVEPSIIKIKKPVRHNKHTFDIQPTINMTKEQFENMVSGIKKRPVYVSIRRDGSVECFYKNGYINVDLQVCKDYVFKSQGYEVSAIRGVNQEWGDDLIQIILKSSTSEKIKL